MTKKVILALMITMLSIPSGTPAFAAKSLTKSYKLSVTLPPTVGIPKEFAEDKKKGNIKSRLPFTIQETVIARDTQEILLHTAVVR